MNFIDYQKEAVRSAPKESQLDALVHASLGFATEGGEFTSEVKRMARYGKSMDESLRHAMIEEIGDILWYAALACEALGVELDAAASRNVAKLRIRFPAGFSGEAAEARADKDGVGHRES